MIRAYDRLAYTVVYGGGRGRGVLALLELVTRRLPTRTVRRLADRADRREAAARYDVETRRVGVLRRIAVDRYDARADAACIYYTELRRRSVPSFVAANDEAVACRSCWTTAEWADCLRHEDGCYSVVCPSCRTRESDCDTTN